MASQTLTKATKLHQSPPNPPWRIDCDICSIKNEKPRSPLWLWRYGNHPDVQIKSLDKSAGDGCPTCKIIRNAAQSIFGENRVSHDTRFYIHVNRGVTYMSFIRSGGGSWFALRIYTTDPKPSYPPWKTLQIPPIPSIRNLQFVNTHGWILEQIDICLKTHDSCEDTTLTSLPTRVIDVNYTLDKVRIIPTNGASGRYITLSHCWGDPNLMSTKLTAHNLEEYMNEGIPLDDFPATFRDAIELTKSFSVPYLWIDCLCILQADQSHDLKSHSKMVREDWEQESASMCAVFAGSYVTLGALASPNCQGGLFYPDADVVELKGTMPDGTPCCLYAEEIQHHDPLERYPLLSRAWVYQETLVSPRTLCFLGREAVWICRGTRCCQCGELEHISQREQENDNQYQRLSTASFKLPSRAINHEAGTQSNERATNHGAKFQFSTSVTVEWVPQYNESVPWVKWHLLVCRYGNNTSITFENDRLTAIEGLAEYFRHWRQGERYFCGVWSGSFVRDLLWRTTSYDSWNCPTKRLRVCSETDKTLFSSDKWLFPTWSWASISNEKGRVAIEYPYFGDQLCGAIAYAMYSCPDSGFLIRPVGEPFGSHDGIANEQNPGYSTGKRMPYELRIEGIVVPITLELLLRQEETALFPFYCDYGFHKLSKWCSEEYEGLEDPKFYCLRVMEYGGYFVGLVLVCVDETRQVYERVGFLEELYGMSYPVEREITRREWRPSWWKVADAESEPEARVITLV